MEKILSRSSSTHLPSKIHNWLLFFCYMIAGCALLTLGSNLRIPFYPVAFTLHTLALSFIALTQSPRLAMASTLLYVLVAQTALGGFCFFGAASGYYVAFPLAAYVIARCARFLPKLAALSIGHCVIYLLGMLWLTPFVGIKTAFLAGVALFIPSDLLKMFLALSAASLWHRMKG